MSDMTVPVESRERLELDEASGKGKYHHLKGAETKLRSQVKAVLKLQRVLLCCIHVSSHSINCLYDEDISSAVLVS